MRISTLFVLVAFTFNCTHAAQAQSFTSSGLRMDVSKETGILPSKTNHYVPKITFEAEVDADTVDQAITLLKALAEQNAEAIIIEWNSPGGSVEEGFRLAKQIENSPVPIICVVDGSAASMAAYLQQSCHVRAMTKRSTLMIHEPAMGARFSGQQTEWRSIADWLSAMTKAMVEHMCRRTKILPADMENKIRGGSMWWLAWGEAQSLGLIDIAVDSVSDITTSYRNDMKPPLPKDIRTR